MIKRICQHCNKEYETFPSIKPKYCSMKCAGEAKKRGQFVACAQCGKEFWKFKSKPDRRYCSRSCAITARNLTDANPAYHRDITGENNPMYGVKRCGTDNPMYGRRKDKAPQWNGGRKIRKDGYILVIARDDHPYPAYTKPSGTKYILEHRRVVEQSLGRYLEPQEVVHHIDGNPSNNQIDNLQIFTNQIEHIAIGHGKDLDSITNDPKYAQYLWSAKWQHKREQALKQASYKCEMCGSATNRLNVHHTTYEHVYDEAPEDLTVLCSRCHPKA